MSTDAIVMLKKDHQEVRRLFREFRKLGADAVTRRGELAERILAELTVHTYLENEVMYPQVRELLPQLDDDVLESYEEHHVADVLCLELSTMSPDDDHFVAKMTVLMENVEHHMEEEEDEWFPKVRDGLGRKPLQDMGQQMLDLRPNAPRRPTEPAALKKAIDAIRA